MLTCHIISSPDLKSEVIAPFLKRPARWVVSDLESKFWMQGVLRKHNNGLICGDHVLRASELWLQLLLSVEPSWQILSPHLAKFMIESWMEEILKENQWKLSQKDCRRAFETMGQILPLLSHFQGESAIEDWFAESGEAKERWYDWYLMGSRLWQMFHEKRIIPLEWTKGVLVNEFVEQVEGPEYIFDLGLDIDDVESELIINLSRVVDVHVIIPKAEEAKEAYQELIARSQIQNYDDGWEEPNRSYKKLPSMLSEVKEAVNQVRLWLESGVPVKKIAIVSPNLENYWPTLSEYLLVEGIPVDKNVVAPLSQFEVYQSWLSHIRLAIKKLQVSDGEQIFYSEIEEPVMNFDQYATLFSNVYDISDFERSEKIKKQVPTVVGSGDRLDFKDFLSWSFSIFPNYKWNALIELLSDFDEVFASEVTLSMDKWLEFFENYFSRTEKKISTGDSEGLSVLSPTAVINYSLSHVMLIGLSESNLTESHDTALHWTDIESIKIRFGFSLPHADRQIMESRLNWLNLKSFNEIVYTHSETDFSGQFQSPSLYWLKGAINHGHSLDLDSPGKTRWDELMITNQFDELEASDSVTHLRENLMARDTGLNHCEQVPYEKLSLSASSLEEFFKCPFRFFAQKRLHLTNLPSLDLDIDYMTRGRLIHKICEVILSNGSLVLSDEDIEKLIEKSRADIDMPVYNSEIWRFLKPYYFDMTKRFLKKELAWRNKYPATQTWGLEKKISAFLKCEGERVIFSENEGIPFRGFIDRIDSNGEGQFAVIDYKTGGSGLTQPGSWLKHGQLQLLLYTLALGDGMLDGESKEVVSAVYYIMKTMDRDKGFIVQEADGQFLPSKKMTKDQLHALLEETRHLVGKMVQQLENGRMEPSPADEKICESCDWNKLCRHPQLNQ